MWGVGISFLMMGSVPFWVKRVKGKLDSSVLPFYKNISRCGYAVLTLTIVSLFLEEPVNAILPVIPVLVFALWTLRWIKKMKLRLDDL